MIGWLKGIIQKIGVDHCIIDVQGVGYVVSLTSRHLELLGEGEETEIFIEMHVRENEIRLFGFSSMAEKQWFTLLTSVQGVGPKVGLAILSTLSIQEITSAITMQDKAMMGRANGVGPKMATRLVNELKDKIPTELSSLAGASPKAMNESDMAALEKNMSSSARAEAISGLQNLGYQLADINTALIALDGEITEETETGTLIRLALKELAKG